MIQALRGMLTPQLRSVSVDRAIISRLAASGTLALLCLIAAPCAVAQQILEPKHDGLDVTMRVIVDPAATVPDEVVRHIPLPAREPDGQSAKPDAATKGQERAREAQELGREMSERAREMAEQAAEQREQARRSIADERRRSPVPPLTPPRR